MIARRIHTVILNWDIFISDVDNAIETFKRIIKEDPYCLDNMDTYSNLLYVKEMKVELAYLAHRATEIDKYRLETCCIVGKFPVPSKASKLKT